MFGRSDGERDLAALRCAAAATSMLEREEEQQLARAAKRGDARAVDQLVRAHLPLVFAMAGKYARFGVPMNDLVAEGALGLVLATRRFDPERGARLAVYAAYWISAKLRRYTLTNRRLVGPPSTRNGRYLLANLARADRELRQDTGVVPDRDTLAAYLGVSSREIDEVNVALHACDAAMGGGPKVERGTVELAGEDPSPEAIAAQAEERRQSAALLACAFDQLGARERDIIRARHLEAEPRSLAELGVGFGISRERVRQIEARGMHKLRDAVLESVACT